MMVFVLSERQKLPFISMKIDRLMGEFSYPIYLLHYQVGILVVAGFSVLDINVKRPDLLLMSVSIPVILVLSWCISVTLERPIEKIRLKVKS
jgi:peptidoglycan/LPS O-acetylase OafA/YrhL